MKYEWRKRDKSIYLPKATPTLIDVPKMNYLTVEGEGNPNSPHFSELIKILYSYSYTIKMLPKKNIIPEGYFDYTVFPLEGMWSSKEIVKKDTAIDKDQLTFKIMIRQPEFVTSQLLEEIAPLVAKKLTETQLELFKLETIEEGLNLQMLHIGSFDSEASSFAVMADYCTKNRLERIGHIHKEIYLSDFNRVPKEKLKTILRFPVKDNKL